MNADEFEQKVLQLWTTSRVPLTRANLVAFSEAPRSKVEKWLDELVKARVLDLDSDDEGELLYSVRGAQRPSSGTASVADAKRKREFSAAIGNVSSAGAGALAVAGSRLKSDLERHPGDGKKSWPISVAASFFLGPLGWLYAGALKEAVPAALIYLLALYIVPNFILWYVLGVLAPVSAIIGFVYVWGFNKKGSRQPLFRKDKLPALPVKR